MRPMLILTLTTAALLGACASRSNTAGTDACTQRCATAKLSALEHSSCELDCSRLAGSATTPPSTPPATPPATPPTTAPPQPQPLPPQQPPPQPLPPKAPAPQPLPPTPSKPGPQPTPAGSTTNYSLPPGGGAPVPTPAPGSSPSAPSSPGVNRQAIADCESTCIRENPDGTDQATCKLNCNAVGSSAPAAPSYYIQGSAPPSDANARAAVIRSSGGVAGSTQPGTPPNQDKVARCAAEAQQCNSSCAGQSDPCIRGCDEGRMSSTDRATCKLTCESSVDLCRDDCRIKEGNCRTKP